MGAPTGLLATMALTLLCSCAPVHSSRAERCSGFRHLENGRTFFRYGGLLVIFRCDPGYKLHGYRTNSCVSGHWSRELPACVGSACPSPGSLFHGTSSVNEDVSWAMFSCDSGFKLQGPSMLYCKGHAWNGTKPVCKESDMMSSASQPAVQKPHMQQNRHNAQAPVGVNHQRHSLYDTLLNTASKEAYLKLGSPSNVPSQTPNSEGSKMSSRELPLKEWVQYPDAEIPLKEAARLLHPGVHIQRDTGAEEGSVKPSSILPHGGTVKNDSVAEHSSDDMEKGNRGTESFPMPLTPAMQVTTESEPSPTVSPAPPPRIQTSAPIAVTNGASERGPAADTVASVQTQASTSVLLVLGGENVSGLQSQAHVSPPVLVTGSPANEDAVNYPFLDERSTQAGSMVDSGEKLLLGTRPLDLIQSTTEPPIKHQPDRMQQTQGPYTGSRTPSSSHTASISPQTFTSSSPLTPSLSPAYSAPTALSSTSFFTAIGRTSTRSNAKVTPPSQTTSDLRPPHQIEHPNLRTNVSVNALTLSLSRGRRPVCPYPPVPAHGTFYFRNVVNPAPTEYKHYIQYACYPGYTLANGDIHSYCHQGGAWSGVTPVCLELTPCSVNNGGCSQICLHSWNHNESETTSTRCHCRPGFTLLEDKRTCRDLDECVEGQHQCHQKCVNTFGSFKCSCDEGYQLAPDHTSCTDVDECLLPLPAVTGCVFGCVNTPGSFYCQCPAGYSLNTTDGHCQDIDECAVKEGAGPCEEFCHNSPGSYSCSCSYGYSLAGDGHGCLPQCSPGYRKQGLASRLHNSTTHLSREECVDIDECKEMELQVNKCEWQCVNLPGSHRCICPKGYSLQADGAHCKDINECNRKNGGCSHLCLNYRGGYKCACPASHRLSPYSRKKCLPRKTEDAAG